MNAKIKAAVLVASQVAAAAGLRSKIREARRDGDRLALADSLITVLSVITGTALAVRTLRKGEDEQ
ncbi:hypothetical protein DFQ14_11815 [Halopolyspora algeriensis]|uniref:Uncharacterized protein n=1 Tax=Halopolyspora algeriensis TaxID=1500506 RepID=A0A368VEJ4_9ACTN|nr:hypothetical protein [Halopolyspora algeriensis]RCW39123.1 hypothetical protein DFQ14_11815 [Halopolyspora algeriensis]TQM56579.1 hypothetical protein FHU43_1382 [Halopolyspora algeriensis]